MTSQHSGEKRKEKKPARMKYAEAGIPKHLDYATGRDKKKHSIVHVNMSATRI